MVAKPKDGSFGLRLCVPGPGDPVMGTHSPRSHRTECAMASKTMKFELVGRRRDAPTASSPGSSRRVSPPPYRNSGYKPSDDAIFGLELHERLHGIAPALRPRAAIPGPPVADRGFALSPALAVAPLSLGVAESHRCGCSLRNDSQRDSSTLNGSAPHASDELGLASSRTALRESQSVHKFEIAHHGLGHRRARPAGRRR